MNLFKKREGEHKGTLARNTLIFTGMTFVQKALAFLLLPLYSHYMSTEETGIYTLVNSLFALFILLFSFALDDAVAKRYFNYKDDPEKQKRAVGTIVVFALILSVGGGVLLILLHPVLVAPFANGIPFFPYLLLGIVPVMATSVYNILQKVLLIEEKAMTYSLVTLGFFLVYTGLCMVFVIGLRFSALGILLANAIAYTLFFLFSLVFLRNRMTWCLDMQEVKDTFFYCAKLLPNRLASWGSSYLNNVIVGNFVSKEALGVYGVALQFQNILIILANALSHAVQPWVYKNIQAKTLNGKENIFYALSFLYCYIGFGVSVLGKDVIYWLYAEGYHDAYRYLPLLVLGSMFSALSSLLVYILFYHDDVVIWVSISTACGVVFNVLISFLLVGPFGVWACAAASACADGVRSLIVLLKAKKKSGLKLSLIGLFGFALVNFGVAQGLLYFDLPLWVRLIACVVEGVGLLAYFKKIHVVQCLKDA